MGFLGAIKYGFRRYVTFSDRACRSEFWFWQLFIISFSIVLTLVDMQAGTFDEESGQGFLGLIFSLIIFLPSFAIMSRRLHDINKRGWWMLVMFIPLIGLVLLIYWGCKKGNTGSNRFGEDPLA